MDKGRIVASGSLEALVDEYCSFIQVEVTFSNNDVAEKAVKEAFPEAEVTERSVAKLRFRIPFADSVKTEEQIGKTFGIMEELKQNGAIDLYEVSQMSFLP